MITSTSNPQVKRLLQLQKKSKTRNEEGVFVVEGLRMFVEVPQEYVEKVYVSETLFNRKKHNLNWEEFPLEILSDSVFKHVSDTQTPQGVLCIVKQKEYDLATLLDIENPIEYGQDDKTVFVLPVYVLNLGELKAFKEGEALHLRSIYDEALIIDSDKNRLYGHGIDIRANSTQNDRR